MCIAKTFSEHLIPINEGRALISSAPRNSDWQSLDARTAARYSGTDPKNALDAAKVHSRQLRFGPNVIQTVKPRSAGRLLVDQFTSIVIALLAVAGAVVWITGEVLQAIAILFVRLSKSVVGFLTDGKANRAITALQSEAAKTMMRAPRR